MKILKAYRFRLKVTKPQELLLRRYAGCSRYVYNKGLALQIERYEQGDKKLSYPEITKELVKWKNEEGSSFLKDAPAQILQQKLMDLDKAYRNFFQKRAGFPKFRKKGIHDSFRFPEPKQIKLAQEENRIQFPKLGWVKYYNSRTVEGAVKNVTISRCHKHWYMSIQTELEVNPKEHSSQSLVGVDLGIAHLATLSDGTHIPSIQSLKSQMKKLRQAQKSLSRKKKGSKNREKARTKVARVHQKVSNMRKDYVHKITTNLSKNHAIIVLEDLRVRNMSKSAAGTIEKPGRNVKAKSALNRNILHQGWFEFRRQLEYKQSWRGGQVVLVSPQYTSQRCAQCQHVSLANRQTQSLFHCEKCGHQDHADVNAAKNILAAGHAVNACGEAVRPRVSERKPKAASVKQEPPLKMQAVA